MNRNRLLSIARREIMSQNLELSVESVSQIEQLLLRGIERMRSSGAIDNAGHVILAKRNLRLLIRYFCDYARDVHTFPKLSNSGFQRALLACPTIWPYNTST